MKNKSKRIFFAAGVLRVLLLIIPVSALAAVEEGQEIGVPQAMEVPVKGCFGAVLSPDGDSFYTVREGLLTQYKINPFKRINAIAIDWKQLNEKSNESKCRVLMTNDKSKLIFVYDDRMFLLDAHKGKVLNKVERKHKGGGAAMLNDNDLLIMDRVFLGEDKGYSNILTIWDANTFKLKKEIYDFGKNFGYVASGGTFPMMSKILDRIYMTTYSRLVVLNSKTYMPELTLLQRPDFHSPSFAYGYSKISKNFKKLYVAKVSEVTDHLNGKQTSYDEFKFSSVLVFDQETREFSIVNANSIVREELDPFLVHSSQLTRNKDYVMLSAGLASWINLNTGMWFGFYQYESGEEILMAKPPGGDSKYFQSTPGARKYLMMKNSAGKIVPINNATFAKYYRMESVQ